MAEFLGEFVLALFQLALECSFAGMKTRAGCIVSAAALCFLFGAGVLFIVALAHDDQTPQINLLGLSCCCFGLFIPVAITAAFFSSDELKR